MRKEKIRLVLAMFIFGSIGLFVRYIDLPSGLIACARGFIGGLILLIARLARDRSIDRKLFQRNALPLMLAGAAMGFNWIFLFEAYRYTTISVATLCYYVAPMIVILLAPLILKERLTMLKAICAAAAFVGMVLVLNWRGGTAGTQLRGVLFGLAAAGLYATVMLSNKFIKGMRGIDSAATQLLTAALVLLPYVLLREDIALSGIRASSVWALAVVCVFHTGLAYLLYFSSIQRLPAQTAAVFSYIDPITAIVLSSLFLDEKMSVLQLLGGVLILGAAFVSEWFAKRA